MMDQLIAGFPDQIREALKIGNAIQVETPKASIKYILVVGMGGSGIGANFVQQFVQKECSVPIQVCKSYEIPAWVGPHTLVVCSSYSGNTEETLSGFYQALEAGAPVFCISSGGKLIAEAKERGLGYVELPNDSPSPRACLGYSLIQQIVLLNKMGWISDARIQELQASAHFLEEQMDDIRQRAKNIARFLEDKFPIIYTTDHLGPVAVRWRQQFNENAKMLCSHHIIPEMNHNELVGWRDQHSNVAVLILRSDLDHPRNQTRIDINKEIIEQYTNTLIEVYAKGDSLIEQSMYLIHLGDWISWYLSDLRQMDAIEVHVIDYLKNELSKV